jgi:NADH-quinone oxidoreductase subunit J
MQLALFIIFGALALGGALNLLFQRHPINSALSLVVIPGAAAIFCLLSFVFLSERNALASSNIGGDLSNRVDNIAAISAQLFTKQLLPFEVTSILILVAILGAVVLARKEQ